jgi:formamidopyrimidine-DNA glycosylase
MIAGRLRWRGPREKLGFGGKMLLASFTFPNGTLFLTEASSKKRASIQIIRGEAALSHHDPGGLEPLDATLEAFAAALASENHTLKRALTDPHLFSGIGNAYSDEILHAARLSPMKLTQSMADEEITRLYDATRATLRVWIDHLRSELKGGFPEKVTAFHDAMAVHGRFKRPCPVCGAPIQRIVYTDNECNYCARCQTGGRVLADRSLSRLLKDDWPRSL